MGEVGGVISDTLDHAGISGFGTTDVGNSWGRIGLETAGSALVAGLSGGNIGATAAGTAAGDAAAIATREWAGSVAQAITNDGNVQLVIENMLSNAIGTGAGAAGGAAAGGSGHTMLNALAGSGYASAIQQFNQANENEKTIKEKDLPEGWIGAYPNNQKDQLITVVYSEGYKKEYNLVRDGTFPVHDDNGKAIFREKATGDYYVFVDGKLQIPSLPQRIKGSYSGLQQTDDAREQVDPETGRDILRQVEKQAALNDLRNSHLSYLINPNGSFIGTKGTGNAQVMPASSDPNVTAEAFAKQAFGNKVPLKIIPLTVKGQTGAWYATFANGSVVTYRPAGAAGIRTPSDMATVEVKSDDIDKINNSKNLKLKFPKE